MAINISRPGPSGRKVNTITRGDARYYIHPETGERSIGVTSVLNCLPKPFLTQWAAKSVAEAAVASLPEIISLVLKGNEKAAIDMLKRTPTRDVRQAAETGTEAHKFMDEVLHGRALPPQHPEIEAFIDQVRDFTKVVEPEVVYTEQAVWSKKYGYSGRFDGLLKIDGQLAWFDGKTTRSGIHDEVALQLTAYSRADVIVFDGGAEVPLPQSDRGLVFHFRPEGWKLVPVDLTDDCFDVFLSLLNISKKWEHGPRGESAPKNSALGATLLRREGGVLYDVRGEAINGF